MIFLSAEFLAFCVCSFALYWGLGRLGGKVQNAFVVVAGCIFCGWGDYRFALLLLAVALITYFAGCFVAGRRIVLACAVSLLIGILALFKYYNFFIGIFGGKELHLILPLGISFYIFMAVGYLLDIYGRKIKAESDPICFFAFICFFPQLMSGPIGRAHNQLVQFKKRRVFTYELAVDGCRQFLWGAFKKAIVADLSGRSIGLVFSDPTGYGCAGLWMGACLFSVQIYADFSGYSDMAIGVGKLFGVQLPKNFSYPYFATNIADFWRRWHISLTSWFRDYLYFPLGGSRCSMGCMIRNTMVVFFISGLWHGAAWTFVVWGVIHGLLFVPSLIGRRNATVAGVLGHIPSWCRVLATLICVVLAWVVFRADSLENALIYWRGMFNASFGPLPAHVSECLPFIALMFLLEWISRQREHALSWIGNLRHGKMVLYILLIWLIFAFQPRTATFIYAQF